MSPPPTSFRASRTLTIRSVGALPEEVRMEKLLLWGSRSCLQTAFPARRYFFAQTRFDVRLPQPSRVQPPPSLKAKVYAYARPTRALKIRIHLPSPIGNRLKVQALPRHRQPSPPATGHRRDSKSSPSPSKPSISPAIFSAPWITPFPHLSSRRTLLRWARQIHRRVQAPRPPQAHSR